MYLGERVCQGAMKSPWIQFIVYVIYIGVYIYGHCAPRWDFWLNCLSAKLCSIVCTEIFMTHIFCNVYCIGLLYSLQLTRHPVLLLSEWRKKQTSADRIDVFSLLHLSLSFFGALPLPKPLHPPCVFFPMAFLYSSVLPW